MTTQVTVQNRTPGINPRALRRSGKVPAVLYGHRGTKSVSLELDMRDVESLMKQVTVNNTVFQLQVERGWSGDVLLREVQRETLRGTPEHLSFFAIAGHGPIAINLPLVFTGESRGVKIDGGVLEKLLTELSVSGAPDEIPEAIEVDVSNLGVGDILYLKDLHLPEGVEVSADPDLVVATIAPSATRRELQVLEAEQAQTEAAEVPTEAGEEQ